MSGSGSRERGFAHQDWEGPVSLRHPCQHRPHSLHHHLLSGENPEDERQEEEPSGWTSGGLGPGLPMALRACLSSRAKAVRGTSSDAGMTATVERLLAGFPESHLLPTACSPNW